MNDGYVFRIAPAPDDLATVRIFARSVARALTLGEGPSEDLELVASELCAEVIESGASAITLRIDPLPESLAVTIDAEDATLDLRATNDRRDLLGSMAPSLRWNPVGAECVLAREAVSDET